jgi:ribonuclease HI
VVATKVVSCFNASLVTKTLKATFKLKRPPRLHQLVGWFHGVASGDGLNSGVGGALSLNANSHLKWTFNTGDGTNNRAELLGVWNTLFLSIKFNLPVIQIIGDSKLVIDWCKGCGRLQSLVLEGWKEQIKRLSI